ncbi:CCR4-NOT transcription complex subunit 9-like isoform X3 [Panicum hallii]|uniref:CCR4-NOT transcription complex subunit 9-like isoform X3 n=1 Tax=Panicum hallii TaxID=206008 RepID=UPI000DF4D58B|nr:CCR4-NOT transcription complex subunit 9-like isoform X3 [Panicum hallii]
MANPPPLHSGGPSSVAPSAPAPPEKDESMATAEQLLLDLCIPELREETLKLLSQNREKFQQDIAPLLWHSFGTMSALLLEIVSIYGSVARATLTQAQSNHVCNALALLQCVASHPDTKMPFINAQIPLYLYPFLSTAYKAKEYEFLRLTSLGVIGALVKVDDHEVIAYLLSSQIIPLCLLTMDMGSEISKTVATFIVQKIMLDDTGLMYPSPRLLKHIIRCYLRLTDNPSARDALRTCLPTVLTDGTFNDLLETQKDQTTRLWLHQMLHNIAMASSGRGGSHGPHADLNRIMGR